jgi:hypothetical protein
MLLKNTIENGSGEYDEDDIEEIVDRIEVLDDGAVIFQMIGGLRFKERIDI